MKGDGCPLHVNTHSPAGQQVQAIEAPVLNVSEPKLVPQLLVSTAWTRSGFLLLIPAFSPVTVHNWALIGDRAAGSGPVVPERMAGHIREMVDPE